MHNVRQNYFSAGLAMQSLPKKILKALILFSVFTFTSFANVLINYIPYIIEISKQVLLSLTLVTSYLLNVKPEFPSQADPAHQSDGIKTSLFQQFLHDISKQTGVMLTPEVLSQLKNAGMHHDYQKLGTLLASLDTTNKSIVSLPQKSEINPYAHTQGIKKFKKPADSQKSESIKPHYKPTQIGIQTFTISSQNQEDNSPITSSVKIGKDKEYSSEFPTASHLPNTQLVLNSNIPEPAKRLNSSRYMHHMMQQQLSYANEMARYEWHKAYTSVADHFYTPELRSQLKNTIQNYQKVLQDACQIGGSAKALQAQTQIALQSLPLPGFLNEFAEILQEKISRICFTHSGEWEGVETKAQLEELQNACKPFQNLIDAVSEHFQCQTPAYAQACIEELYLMDQGRGNWASRFFSWMGNFFDSQALSLTQLQSRIAHSPFNQQAFTALELLENNEFKLARIPLEDMAQSAKTANSILLNQALLEEFKHKVTLHYGTTNIPLKYQNDPVFWLYKPSAEQMEWDDPSLKLIEGHLAIRDTMYNQIIKIICKNQHPSPLVSHLAYNLIDKLDDPIALIDQLEFLSSDSNNPEIQQACNAFFDKGVLNLFGLRKQASGYRVPISDILNQSEYTHLRTALNKLLLVDPRTETSKKSLQLVFDCMPHACTNTTFSKDYQNIIQAITQAHIDAKAPKEILHISCFPINPTKDLHITLLKAISKAAQEDLARANPAASSPLTTREAWACIQKVQDLENKGETAEANALANTYLKGYLDEKMPIQKYLNPLIIITTASATVGTYYANSQEQPKQTSKIFEHPGSKTSNNAINDKESEEIKKYKSILEEILSNAKPGRETTTKKLKQYEKEGGLEQAIKDFEKLNPSKIRNIPKGKLGELLSGIRINVRTDSSDKRPTLEIHNSITDQRIKIRYNI